MWPHNLWLSYVAGIQLIVLAVLRLFTIFRYSGAGKDEGLLPQYDDSFDKYDKTMLYALSLTSFKVFKLCNFKIHRDKFLMNVK